jgi:putative inorganic carbon (hco3(-)) transporter
MLRRHYALLPVSITLLLGLWAGVIAVLAVTAPRIYALAMLVGTLMPLALYLSGNPRLFFFIGTVYTAMLGLSINFMLRTHMGGAPSFAIDAVDFFLFPLLAFQIRDRLRGWRPSQRLDGVSLCWWGLIVLGLLAVALGPFRTFAAFEVVRMFKLWLLFIVVANECVREQHFRVVVLTLAAGLLTNVLVALAQYALRRTLGLQALGEPSDEAVRGANFGVYLSSDVFRVSGLAGHPNLFGAYIALLLPLLIGALFTAQSLWRRLLIGSVVALGGLALLLTLSRAAWVAAAAALLVFLLVVLPRVQWTRRHPWVKGALMASIPLATLAAAPSVIRRIQASDSGAFEFREQWVAIAWRMIGDAPVLGHGLNTFRLHVIDYAPYSASKMTDLFGPIWPVVHNAWLLVWAEQGSVGMMLFVGLHLVLLVTALRNLRLRLSDTVSMANLGAACGVIAIMVDGLASFFTRVPAQGRMFWIVAAIIIAADRWNRRNRALRPDDAADRPPQAGP